MRSVSGILQFSGNKEHLNITEVRYAGCGKDDFEVGMDGILGLHLQVFPMMEELNAVMPAGERAGLDSLYRGTDLPGAERKTDRPVPGGQTPGMER